MVDSRPEPRRSSSRAVGDQRDPIPRWSLVVLTVIVVGAAAKLAAVAVMPIVASLILCLLLWPVQTWLCRWVPRWLAAVPTTGLIVVAALGLAGWGWYAGSAAMDRFQESREAYLDHYNEARSWLLGVGVPRTSIPRVADADGAPSPAPQATGEDAGAFRLSPARREQVTALAAGGLQTAAGALAAVLLTVFLCYLALVEGEGWGRRLRTRLPPATYSRVERVVTRWTKLTRAHFLAKAFSGVVSGGATALWLWTMGVPLPIVWGVLTFLLNFVPNIGALISSVPPTLMAVIELGWWQAALVLAGLIVIEMVVGNLIDPAIAGDMLGLSTFVVLASMVIWGWIWGVAGAVLAPVLTAMIVQAVDIWRSDEPIQTA